MFHFRSCVIRVYGQFGLVCGSRSLYELTLFNTFKIIKGLTKRVQRETLHTGLWLRRWIPSLSLEWWWRSRWRTAFLPRISPNTNRCHRRFGRTRFSETELELSERCHMDQFRQQFKMFMSVPNLVVVEKFWICLSWFDTTLQRYGWCFNSSRFSGTKICFGEC